MTRLREEDLHSIVGNLPDYDAHLRRTVGVSLRQIACRAAGVDETLMESLLNRVRFAAVPVSSGQGVIAGFSETVSAIVSHVGFDAFVTEASDVAGMAEGIESGADCLLAADDERFVAMVPGLRKVVDNSRATAQGFAAGLERMREGLEGESVLVLGCGPVGVAAAEALLERGAVVGLCDTVEERAVAALRRLDRGAQGRVGVEDAVGPALGRYELLFDATDAGGFIEPGHLTSRTMVAAPGMPCALTPDAMAEHGDRILHDPLEIGTATMAVLAAAMLAPRTRKPRGR